MIPFIRICIFPRLGQIDYFESVCLWNLWKIHTQLPMNCKFHTKEHSKINFDETIWKTTFKTLYQPFTLFLVQILHLCNITEAKAVTLVKQKMNNEAVNVGVITWTSELQFINH